MKNRIYCFLLFYSSLSLGQVLGHFSQVPEKGEGFIWNLHYSVYVERGFKVFAILPRLNKEGNFGESEYDGFWTLLIDGAEFLYPHFKEPKEGTQIIKSGENHIIVAKRASTDRYEATLLLEAWLGYPYLRIWAEVKPKTTLRVEYVLTGYEWVNEPAPDNWELPLKGGIVQKRSKGIIVRGGELSKGWVLFWSKPYYANALLFSQPPLHIERDERGIRISFSQELLPSKRYVLPSVWQVVLPLSSSFDEAADLPKQVDPSFMDLIWRSALANPKEISTHFGEDKKGTFVAYKASFSPLPNSFGVKPYPLIPVPPTLLPFIKPHLSLPSYLGDIGYVEGNSLLVHLPLPPNFLRLNVDFPPLGEYKELVERYVEEILSAQNADGTFSFCLGRPFYDGLTLSVLVQIYPILSPSLKERTKKAIQMCLEHWWGRIKRDTKWGIYYFPEPPPALPLIDYPEITSTLLYPTASYLHLIDRSYLSKILNKAILFVKSLPKAYDWTGSAYANPGPDYIHIIVESTIGGYLAYASLYHILKLAKREEYLPELKARAAFAFQSMLLYKHFPIYGEDGIASEIKGDGVKIKIEIPWDYTMFTWFSFIPIHYLPSQDVYNLWHVLEKEKWWLYYERSPQRAYDYAHLIALHRFRNKSGEEVKSYLMYFADKPFTYENFDCVPVFAAIAYPWLGVREK